MFQHIKKNILYRYDIVIIHVVMCYICEKHFMNKIVVLKGSERVSRTKSFFFKNL